MKNYSVTYNNGKVVKEMGTREASEEDAILQALTHWAMKDTKTVRKYIKVKAVKRL